MSDIFKIKDPTYSGVSSQVTFAITDMINKYVIIPLNIWANSIEAKFNGIKIQSSSFNIDGGKANSVFINTIDGGQA